MRIIPVPPRPTVPQPQPAPAKKRGSEQNVPQEGFYSAAAVGGAVCKVSIMFVHRFPCEFEKEANKAQRLVPEETQFAPVSFPQGECKCILCTV
jgi:hypothetical protein